MTCDEALYCDIPPKQQEVIYIKPLYFLKHYPLKLAPQMPCKRYVLNLILRGHHYAAKGFSQKVSMHTGSKSQCPV